MKFDLLHRGLALFFVALHVCGARAAETEPHTWRNVEIAGGGFVSGIITHPKQKGLMYARTDIGGAYRWDAATKRWNSISDWVSGPEWNFTGIESIGLDPTDANRVYLAAGTYTNDWAGNGAIFRSADQGRRWQRTDLPFKLGGNEEGRSAGERLAVDPNNPSILFFGTRRNGLWKSTDRGATWQKASFPAEDNTNGVGIVWVQFIESSGTTGNATPTIYAGVSATSTHLYRSTDGGATWREVAGQPKGMLVNHGVLAADGSLYMTYGNSPGPNGMTDGAVWKHNIKDGSWTNVSPLKPGDGDAFGYGGVTVDAQRPGTVMVSTMDRWARGDDLFRSTDGAKTWTSIKEKATHDISGAPWLSWGRDHVDLGHWMGDVEIDPFNSNHVLFITGMGIRATENVTAADAGQATKWIVRSQGIEECVINEIISPPSGAPLLSVMWDIDGFRHANINTSPAGFFKPGYGRNTGIDFAERKPNIVARVYGGSNTNGSYSLDNGVTWTAFASKPPETRGDGTIAVAASGNSLVWTPNEGATFYSRDRGTTWVASVGLVPKLRVVADRVNPTKFYAFDRATGRVSVSNNGGASFSSAARDLPKANGFLRAVPGFEGHLWLAGDEGLYRSVNSGANFAKVAAIDKASKIGFGKAAPGHSYPAIYLVGHRGGVYGFYRSIDQGVSWVRVNDDGHQFAWINSITGDPRVYGRYYVGSASRGIQYAEPVAVRGQTSRAGRKQAAR